MREKDKQYYGSLNINRITDNKNFYRAVKTNFSNKIVTNSDMSRDGSKIISDKEKVVDTFNKFFVNIRSNLKIAKDKRFWPTISSWNE